MRPAETLGEDRVGAARFPGAAAALRLAPASARGEAGEVELRFDRALDAGGDLLAELRPELFTICPDPRITIDVAATASQLLSSGSPPATGS